MRPAIYVAAALALCALAPAAAREVLVAAASVLLESLPYLAAAVVLRPWLGRWTPRLAAYGGCGCTPGPSARSIPAALACAALFGPWIALARLALAALAARVATPEADDHDGDLAADLVGLVPSALLAAGLLVAAPLVDLAHRPLALQLLAGLGLGLGAGPCALGTVALAASLRVQSPAAAYAVLAVGGTIDLRHRLLGTHAHAVGGRAGYALLALACALVASMHGASLVHPRLTIPLALCAVACAWLAWRSRERATPNAVWCAAALVLAVVIGAPLPTYRADETTLADAFAGEHVDFTGAYRAQAPRDALVRYAITCCRADAHPIALLLASPLHARNGTWVRASGTLARRGDVLVLVPDAVRAIAPPHDPFVYE